MAKAISTNFAPMAPVVLVKPNGRRIPYGVGASTDAARAAAAELAIAAAASGDEIQCGPGTFDYGSGRMTDLPTGVTLRGAGKRRTTFVSTHPWTTTQYAFLNVTTDCHYCDFGIIANPAGPSFAASPMGLPTDQSSSVTGWTISDVLLDGRIDSFFISGSGDFTLQGKFFRVSMRSVWDCFRINNPNLVSVDIEHHEPDYIAEGEEGVVDDAALTTAISCHFAGGTVKVFGGVLAGFNGGVVSYGVLNELPGGGTIELLGGVRINTTAPINGDIQRDIQGTGPIVVQSAYFDPEKAAGAELTYAASAKSVAFPPSSSLNLNPPLAAPNSAVASLSGTGSYGNGTLQYRVWTYRMVDGSPQYSASYVESNQITTSLPTQRAATLAVETDGAEDGIKVARTVAGGGYLSYRLASISDGSYSIDDANTGWTSENPLVVTPAAPGRVRINYSDGTTHYGLLSDQPIKAASVVAPRTVQLLAVPAGTALTTGDAKGGVFFRVPSAMNGWNLTSVAAALTVVSSSGTPTIQVRRVRSATPADMLSTAITIDANELDSKDATTPAVIDGSNDDVATGDFIFVDCDVAGTSAEGLSVTLTFTEV